MLKRPSATATPGALPSPDRRAAARTLARAAFATACAAALAAAGAVQAQSANPRVELKTTSGPITIELFPDKAPKSAANFLQYARDGFYNGTVFHRVIDGFMIQGGGFDPKMSQKPTRAPIQNEADNGLKNLKYTVAMARTPDPNSATAQFFINVADNAFLDYKAPTPQGWGYAVFGKVVAGTEVVDKIAKVQTGNAGMFQNVPREPILIESATVLGK